MNHVTDSKAAQGGASRAPKVIVKPSAISSAWHVTLPEYPSNQIWSCHDTQADAEREAAQTADDMGYDGYEVLR